RFGGEPSTIGRQVTLNALPFTIVGVAAPRFFGVQPGRVPDVWVPMLAAPALVPWGFRPADTPSLLDSRGYWWAQVMARLAAPPRARERRVLAHRRYAASLRDT